MAEKKSKDSMTADLNTALAAGDLGEIMGTLGNWPAPTG